MNLKRCDTVHSFTSFLIVPRYDSRLLFKLISTPFLTLSNALYTIYRILRHSVAHPNRQLCYADELCFNSENRRVQSSFFGSIRIGCGFRLSFQQSREDEAVLFEMVPKFGRILPLHVLRSNTGRRFHIARN